MNLDQVAGNWKQFKGHVKEKWGKLTDDDLDVIAGKRDQKSRRDMASPRKRRESSSRTIGSK